MAWVGPPAVGGGGNWGPGRGTSGLGVCHTKYRQFPDTAGAAKGLRGDCRGTDVDGENDKRMVRVGK